MRRYQHSQNTQHVQQVQHTKNVQNTQLQNVQLQKPQSQKTRCERPTLKDNGGNGHVQKLPTKKGHLHQQDLEYFTNHHFSRSFNSLILDDPDDQNQNQTSQLNQHMSKKPLNKSPPFNVKQGNCINHTIDSKVDFFDYEGLDLEFLSDYEIDVATKTEDSRSDHEVVKQARKLTHFDVQKGETELHLNDSSSPSKLGSTTSRKPLLKRSSKFFNLSIDSEFVPGPSSPHFVKEPKLAWLPLDEGRTPFNKFKRPHKLVSQSPSPNSSNKFKLKVAAASPLKLEKMSKMFKNSTSIRMKSPLKLSMLPPTCSSPPTEFLLQRLGKSPNLNFMSSSSPLAGLCFDDHAFRGYDESPLRPKRRASSNFHVYQDQGERRSSATSKTLSDFNAPSTSRSSISEANKENMSGDAAKSAIKSSFKLVKPLQIAFESAGLIKKNSIPKFSKKVTPETPMKRQPLMMITKETKKVPEHESFSNQDNSIELGRNHDGTFLNPNDSTSSYFKLSSLIKSERSLKLDLSEPPDLDLEIIPETPTKLSSREEKLNLLLDDTLNKASMRFAGMLENEPCTPILQFPIDSIASSQATLSLPNGARELNSSVQTITDSSSFNHPRDPLLSESKIIPPKDRSDERLVEKFGKSNITYIGSGHFSVAFECNFQGQKFAIKRNRKPILSFHEKKALLREIDALRALTSFHEGETEVAEGKENLVFFVETWTSQNYFYIMTEFCEGGTLNQFLDDYQNYKLDEFRVWKILIEIMAGLRYIHLKNYLHLDLKPANIFITFDGSLKIGDFGLSAKLPVLEEDFDLEGDRNYIAPELINDKIYTPYADIFSAGLMVLEIAANIVLPDNGPHWRKLRSGDLSDAGKLSSDNISDFLNHRNFSSITSYTLSLQSVNQTLLTANRNNMNVSRSVPEQSFGSYIKGVGFGAQDKGTSERLIDNIRELVPQGAPEFLLDNSDRLGELVSLMTKPNPFDRPTANDILMRRECVEIEARRKAGATIFEGEFGPNDDD